MIFQDRHDAGEQMGKIVVASGLNLNDYSVVGIARGGVIIGSGVAKATSLPILSFYADDYIIDSGYRAFVTGFNTMTIWGRGKINDPTFPRRFFPEIPEKFLIHDSFVKFQKQVLKKHKHYCGLKKRAVPESVILCDDGLVSGKSLMAVIDALRYAGTKNIVVVIPVIPSWVRDEIDGCQVLKYRRSKQVDIPTGMYYFKFEDVSEQEIFSSLHVPVSSGLTKSVGVVSIA